MDHVRCSDEYLRSRRCSRTVTAVNDSSPTGHQHRTVLLSSNTARTAHRDVTDRLRAAILSGELAPGMHLVQSDLAKSMNVSVTPIREALRELNTQGLVEFDAFRGATVHRVSRVELDEVYELRRLLMPLAVRERVARITDAELDAAEVINSGMGPDLSDAEWVNANRDLHVALDGVSDRVHLREFLRRLSEISALYVGLSISAGNGRRARAVDDHRALIKAYRDRDAERVIAISLVHLSDTEQVARTALEQY